MSGRAARKQIVDRAGLAGIALLLVLSVAVRVQAYRSGDAAAEPAVAAGAIDLGEGLALPSADPPRWTLRVAACSRPVAVDLVEASPHGRDTSLTAPDDPDDRVAYVYHGRVLEGRHAAMMLSVLHFAQRAGAVLRLGAAVPADERAVRLVVPAGCDVSPEAAMTVLRAAVQSRP